MTLRHNPLNTSALLRIGCRRAALVALCFAAASVHGQHTIDASDPENNDRNFEVAGSDITTIGTVGGLDITDAGIVGNPMSSVSRKWPEDLVIVPVPGRSPQLGWNLTVAGGYFFDREGDKDGEDKPPASVIGGFAMIAENGSYAYGVGAYLHLMNDDLRVKFGGGYGDVKYEFYGIGNDLPDLGLSVEIAQEAPLYFASATYRIWSKLYLGLGYIGGSVDSRVHITLPDPLPFFDPSIKLDIGAITVPLQFDSRDYQQYPRRGWLINARARIFRESVGSDFDAETIMLNVNHYWPMRDEDVLAVRGYARTSSEDAPFFLLSTFGGGTDLRGYPSGRYRDRLMYALQSEYRWKLNEKWILTGFVGVGEVAEEFSEFGENFLPAAGVGARFVLSKKHRISLSMDIAQGADGTEYYFGIGEAF